MNGRKRGGAGEDRLITDFHRLGQKLASRIFGRLLVAMMAATRIGLGCRYVVPGQSVFSAFATYSV
jgi:hypothetical protein